MTLQKYLEEVKARSAKATKGEWWAVTAGIIWSGNYGDAEMILTTCGRPEVKAANADFVCHSRTDIDKLAAMVEKATEALAGIAVVYCDCPSANIAKQYLAQLDRMAEGKE
jgi:hypothetical protein